jgi:hypothetical protein
MGQSMFSMIDWRVGFDSPFRAWGNVGNVTLPIDRFAGGICDSGTCQIWDWRLRATAPELLRRAGDGSGVLPTLNSGDACPVELNGSTAISDAMSTANWFLPLAIEEIDGVGDDDGLCESNENCLYAPNLGAYQGDGRPAGFVPCVFTSGANATAIKISPTATNGI